MVLREMRRGIVIAIKSRTGKWLPVIEMDVPKNGSTPQDPSVVVSVWVLIA
jgi:hypothetical protein